MCKLLNTVVSTLAFIFFFLVMLIMLTLTGKCTNNLYVNTNRPQQVVLVFEFLKTLNVYT